VITAHATRSAVSTATLPRRGHIGGAHARLVAFHRRNCGRVRLISRAENALTARAAPVSRCFVSPSFSHAVCGHRIVICIRNRLMLICMLLLQRHGHNREIGNWRRRTIASRSLRRARSIDRPRPIG
jgi:hypothetical protein